MFDAEGPECVAFTANATEALNTALFGILHPEREKVHAICTEMDHNSVLASLYLLEKRRTGSDHSSGGSKRNDFSY